MPVLITDLPEFKMMYVDTGYGLDCDSADATSIAKAVRWLLEHPAERAAMGERGSQRIATEWNYETQFQPVRRLLETSANEG
jgi:glycosyltransferase involved in cell wall biosynthesis